MSCSPPGSSVRGILQAWILNGLLFSSSRESLWPRDRTQISSIASRFFILRVTWEAPSCHVDFVLSHLEASNSIPFVQGKEQRLHFAGAAVKRYPLPKVRETQVRWHQRADTLKPYSQKMSQSNHTKTTALSNSMKPSHARGATQDRQVMVERSDRMRSNGERNGKPLSILALKTP